MNSGFSSGSLNQIRSKTVVVESSRNFFEPFPLKFWFLIVQIKMSSPKNSEEASANPAPLQVEKPDGYPINRPTVDHGSNPELFKARRKSLLVGDQAPASAPPTERKAFETDFWIFNGFYLVLALIFLGVCLAIIFGVPEVKEKWRKNFAQKFSQPGDHVYQEKPQWEH